MGDASPSADASVVSGDASAYEGQASPESGSAGGDTGEPGEITELPETGGARLMLLGSGVALAALGLVARKVVGR